MEHLTDCHTHTWYSGDGRCSVDELCTAAHGVGLAAVAITDHFDYAADGGREAEWDLRAEMRCRELERAQESWAGRLEILRGIEIGQPHWNPADSRKLANCGDFDLVIGSIHDLRPGKRIYHDYDFSTVEVCDAMYEQFFDEAREMLRTCDFDVFGHYDYPLRKMDSGVVPPNMERWKAHMLPFLKELAQSGIALELNTSGLRRWMGKPGGEAWILEAFRNFGGRRVTCGSDAHFPRHVGFGVREVCAILRENGFDKVTIYRQRKPVELSI